MPLKSKAEVYLAFLAFPLLRSTFQPDLAKSFKHVVKLVPELRHLLFETMLGSLNSFLCAFLSLVDSLFNSFSERIRSATYGIACPAMMPVTSSSSTANLPFTNTNGTPSG